MSSQQQPGQEGLQLEAGVASVVYAPMCCEVHLDAEWHLQHPLEGKVRLRTTNYELRTTNYQLPATD